MLLRPQHTGSHLRTGPIANPLSYYVPGVPAVLSCGWCNIMSIEQFDKIDSVTIDACRTTCRLAIIDHLEWDRLHLEILQRKINYYLRCVETGEIYLQHPQAAGCDFCIDITAIFEPDDAAMAFILQAREVLESSGFQLAVVPLASSYAHAPI